MASFINSRMALIWQDLPKDLPPSYSTVYWHYKQWRSEGAIEAFMSLLYGQVRQQVKKEPSGQC
jgi:hypothetical protein